MTLDMVPDSEASREELVRRLRIATSRNEGERVTRIKRLLVTRRRTNAVTEKASTPQVRKWWETDD